jgi:hypothetical protein
MTDKTAFKPGDASKINIPSCLLGEAVRNPNKGINIGQATRSFQVDIPARVGYSVKNMATFGPGKAGGSGIGMAVNVFSSTYVLISGSTDVQRTHVRCGRKALIEHHVGVFRACLARLQDIDCTKLPAFACFIVHKDAFAAHCGLGSTSGAALGVLHGLNECFAG